MRSRLPALAGLAGITLLAPAARAAPPSAVRVESAGGTCPTPAALAQTLASFLRSTRILTDEAQPAPAGAATVTIRDLGARYSVRVAGVERTFRDPARRCGERARAAAVFVTVTLDPPSIALTAPEDAARPLGSGRSGPTGALPRRR